MSPVIRPAITQEEQESAQRLRYRVLGLELGDDRWCDHTRRVFSDPDDPYATTLVAWLGGEAVGTIRITPLHRHRFLDSEGFEWGELASTLQMTESDARRRSARLDRGAVDLAARSGGLFGALQDQAEGVALSEGCDVVVGSVVPTNVSALRVFEKVGWNVYLRDRRYQDVVRHRIYKRLAAPNRSVLPNSHCEAI